MKSRRTLKLRPGRRALTLSPALPLPQTVEERATYFAARVELATKSRTALLDARIAVERTEAEARIAQDQARLDTELQERKAASDADLVEAAAENDADRKSAEAFSTTVMEVAKSSIERSRSTAEFVQKAATAIFALYTGALAIAFSVTARPLPARGILPSVFLGLAITLATGYLAYLTRSRKTAQPEDAEGRAEAQLARTRAFLLWIYPAVISRSYWLRASVIALAVGAVVLPMAFLRPPSVFQAEPLRACAVGEAADAVRLGCMPGWPSPPAPSSGASSEKLFADQLAEVTAARAEVARTPDRNEALMVGGILVLGMLLVFVLPAIRPADKDEAEQTAPQESAGDKGLLLTVAAVQRPGLLPEPDEVNRVGATQNGT